MIVLTVFPVPFRLTLSESEVRVVVGSTSNATELPFWIGATWSTRRMKPSPPSKVKRPSPVWQFVVFVPHVNFGVNGSHGVKGKPPLGSTKSSSINETLDGLESRRTIAMAILGTRLVPVLVRTAPSTDYTRAETQAIVQAEIGFIAAS